MNSKSNSNEGYNFIGKTHAPNVLSEREINKRMDEIKREMDGQHRWIGAIVLAALSLAFGIGFLMGSNW